MVTENTSTPRSDGLTAVGMQIASDSQRLIFSELAVECVRGVVKHGPVPPTRKFGTNKAFKEVADQAKAVVDGKDDPTWFDILTEEMYEALAEEDWPDLRRELIQVGAVVVSMIEDGDLKNARKFLRTQLRQGLLSHRSCLAHGEPLCCTPQENAEAPQDEGGTGPRC